MSSAEIAVRPSCPPRLGIGDEAVTTHVDDATGVAVVVTTRAEMYEAWARSEERRDPSWVAVRLGNVVMLHRVEF